MHFKATKASPSVVHDIFGQQLMGKHILQDIDLGFISIGWFILVSTNHIERRLAGFMGSDALTKFLLERHNSTKWPRLLPNLIHHGLVRSSSHARNIHGRRMSTNDSYRALRTGLWLVIIVIAAGFGQIQGFKAFQAIIITVLGCCYLLMGLGEILRNAPLDTMLRWVLYPRVSDLFRSLPCLK